MSLRTKLFTAYEKAELTEPADRVVLVPEGFSLWAFVFSFFWLIYHRLWVATLGYIVLLVLLGYVSEQFGLSEITVGLVQLFLQVMLGFSAHDLRRQSLRWRGYHFTGVVAAETPLNAERRYYDRVA